MLEGLHHWSILLIFASLKVLGSFPELIYLDNLADILSAEYTLVSVIHFRSQKLNIHTLTTTWTPLGVRLLALVHQATRIPKVGNTTGQRLLLSSRAA